MIKKGSRVRVDTKCVSTDISFTTNDRMKSMFGKIYKVDGITTRRGLPAAMIGGFIWREKDLTLVDQNPPNMKKTLTFDVSSLEI